MILVRHQAQIVVLVARMHFLGIVLQGQSEILLKRKV